MRARPHKRSASRRSQLAPPACLRQRAVIARPALLAASGSPGWSTALDYVVLQKLLPRLHGARRRLEPVLVSLARFAYDLSHVAVPAGETPFDPLGSLQAEPELPLSFQKLVRMTRSLRANQFASFME